MRCVLARYLKISALIIGLFVCTQPSLASNSVRAALAPSSMAEEIGKAVDAIQKRLLEKFGKGKHRVFFDDESIDSVLRLSNSSLQKIKAKLSNKSHAPMFQHLEELRTLKSKNEIKQKILSFPTIASDYFPLAYNSVNQHFSVSEFLDLILKPKGSWERSKIFRWMPLIQPFLKKNGVQNVIHTLIENEKDEESDDQWGLYTHLAMYASMWIEYVDPVFAEHVLNTAFELNRDFPLFNFVPWYSIPARIRESRFDRYIRKTFESLEITDRVIPVQSQDQYAGTCAWCQDLHWATLMERDYDYNDKPGYGKVGIIRVNGKAVFSLKLFREPSMVALRTMRTPDGRLASVRGALYIPTKKIRELFDGFDYEKDTFMMVDVEEPIKVFPLGWVDTVDTTWKDSDFGRYRMTLSKLAVELSENKFGPLEKFEHDSFIATSL